jgi:Holliday junction resolvase
MLEWNEILEQGVDSVDYTLSIQKIATVVDELGSVDALGRDLVKDVDVWKWLTEFYEVIHSAGLEALFDTKAILPNQKGEMCLKGDLLFDDDIDESLKEIADHLSVGVGTRLLAKQAGSERNKPLLQSKTTAALRDDCIKRAKQLASDKSVTPEEGSDKDAESNPFPIGNAKLLSWLVVHEEFDALNDYPVAVGNDATEFYRLRLEEPSVKVGHPLMPAYAWPEKAQEFEGIFHPRNIASEAYQEHVDRDQWRALGKAGFMRTEFVEVANEKTDWFVSPNGTVMRDEPKDKTKIESAETFDQRQIVFLADSSSGLIDRNRQSVERAVQLLRFVLEYIIPTEADAFQAVEIPFNDDADDGRKVYKAQWLISLASRSWLPAANKRSTKPSAEAIGALIRADPSLSKLLLSENGRKLLRVLGVGPSDLTLHGLSDKEETRNSLMQSFAQLSDAAGGDAERISRVADEIGRKPELLETIEKHRLTRENVERNQKTGYLVEKLLYDAFDSSGLSVTRAAIGSDCEVKNDFVEADEEQGIQVAGEHASVLIEIKSSRTDKISMTPTQARLAVDQADRFMLCVVTINIEPEEVDLEYVKQNARFVTDIGERLSNAVLDLDEFEETKNATGATLDDQIEIDISDSTVRVLVPIELAKQGKSFDEAIDQIKEICASASGGIER